MTRSNDFMTPLSVATLDSHGATMPIRTTDVIIPARNEDKTIGPIVHTFAAHPDVARIIVVIDRKTTDETAYLAEMHGATHVIHADARGKGQCMQAGLTEVTTRRVIFCDADLYGLTQNHITALVEGRGLTIGVPDPPIINPYPATLRRLYQAWPWISGERSLPTVIASKLDLHGYLAEVQINEACRAASVAVFQAPLTGLYAPVVLSKTRLEDMERDRKWGIERGILERNRGEENDEPSTVTEAETGHA
jgi:glycosyltransferase involved in cell wall biosynthesis